MSFFVEKGQYIATLGGFPSLLLVMKFCIDNFDTRSVERRFMTNTKKFGIFLSVVFVFSILFTVFLFVLSTSSADFLETFKKSPLVTVVLLLIISFVLFLCIYGVVYVLNTLIGIKVRYYIKGSFDDLGIVDWYLDRKVGKKTILLIDEKKRYYFCEESKVKSSVIFREEIEMDKGVLDKYRYIKKHQKKIFGFVIMLSVFLLYLCNKFSVGIIYYYLSIIVLVFMGAAVMMVADTVNYVDKGNKNS